MLKKKWLFLPVAGIFLIGIIIGSFLDLQINQALYDRYNGFGIFFAAFGEFPVYSFLGVMAAGFVLLCKTYKKLWQRIALIVLALGCIGVSVYFQGKHIVSWNAYNRSNLLPLAFGIALFMVALAFVAGYFLFKYATIKPMQILIILLSIMVIYGIAIGLNQILKNVMCRPRSRFLFETETMNSNYREWWERGKSVKDNWVKLLWPGTDVAITTEEFKSFPSGHMANTMILLPMFLFVPIINNHVKLKEEWIVIISVLWNLVLAYTRMRVGAHFLSDVCMGAFMTIVVTYAVNELFCFVYKKYGGEQEAVQQE